MGHPPVLLIHGFGSAGRLTWERSGWTGLLERAGRSWIAPDLLGHGAAAKPHTPDAYSVSTLLDQLLRETGSDAVDVVGYSLGGELALELAGAHPERVRRLIAGGIGASRPLTAEQADGILAHVRDGAALPEGNATALWSMVTANPANDVLALAACIAGFIGSDRLPSLRTISAPSLLFAGSADELSAGIEDVAGALPRAELVTVAGRHHGTALSAATLKQRALDFLEA